MSETTLEDATGSHLYLRVAITDLDVHELMVLQELGTEVLDVDIFVEADGEMVVAVLQGFRHRILWLGTLFAKALCQRLSLEQALVAEDASPSLSQSIQLMTP